MNDAKLLQVEIKTAEINAEILRQLRGAELELSPDAVARFRSNRYSSHLEIGIADPERNMVFSSEVGLSEYKGYTSEPVKINFATSGSFTPDNVASYWRTIHAAEILKNWDKVAKIFHYAVDEWTAFISELEKQDQ